MKHSQLGGDLSAACCPDSVSAGHGEAIGRESCDGFKCTENDRGPNARTGYRRGPRGVVMAMSDYEDVPQRLADVRGRISMACKRAGRSVKDVRLIAVSKGHPVEAIVAAYAEGQRDFGENYVQEMQKKMEWLTTQGGLEQLHMRFIGRLQRNKAGTLVPYGCTVDAIDSERLAQALSQRAEAAAVVIEGLLQINIGREAQKAGVMPERAAALARLVHALPGLRLRGLMAIPPAVAGRDVGGPDGLEATRGYFGRMRSMALELSLPELSMGMSNDLETAIEHGATMVRIGTSIFGPRPAVEAR